MPINNDVPVEELVGALATRDQSTVVTQMQALAKNLYQSIFQKGFDTSVARSGPEKTQLEGEIAGLKEQLKTLTDQNKQLAEKAPELATIQQQHKDAVAKLEQTHKDAVAALNTTLITERMSRAEKDLISHLKDLGVDGDFAEVTVDKAKKANRLRKNDKGLIEAFRADADVPFAATDKKDGLMLLAEELKTTVPAKFINVNGDSGGGTSSEAGGGGGGGGKKASFKQIREDVKAKETRGSTTDTAASRLTGGSRRPAAASG